MNALFSEDVTPEINKLAEELKSYSSVDEYLQNKISRYVNLRAYQHYRLNQVYRDYIEKLYKEFIQHLDIGEKQFLSKFKTEFCQCFFELVMANFLSEKFALQKRSDKEQRVKKGKDKSMPDLKFIFNNKLYFMECTSRYTTLVDRHLKNIGTFNLLFELAEIFSTVYEKMKIENPYIQGSWHRETAVHQTLDKMDAKEKSAVTELMQKLEIKDVNDLVIEFNNWIEFYQELYWEFKEILSEEIIKKIEKIIAPIFLVKHGIYGDGSLNFLIKSLAVKILEKLGMTYFKEKKSIVLAISLSILPNAMKNNAAMEEAARMGINIGELLLVELNNIMNDGRYTKEKIKELSEKVKYLYAILIDANWYNWFPNIVEEQFDAKFPNGHKNCYRIIYNQNLAQDIDFDHGIFDALIFPEYTNFSSFVLEGDSVELIKTRYLT